MGSELITKCSCVSDELQVSLFFASCENFDDEYATHGVLGAEVPRLMHFGQDDSKQADPQLELYLSAICKSMLQSDQEQRPGCLVDSFTLLFDLIFFCLERDRVGITR